MPPSSKSVTWRVITHTQQGASHIRDGTPNQDAVRSCCPSDEASTAILAVADGHGSARCFRSHIGSQLAVDAAIETCREFLDELIKSAPSVAKQAAERQMPSSILQQWRRLVDDHFDRHPFTEQELMLVPNQSLAGNNIPLPYLAYGATLLTAFVTNTFMICIQIGDGDILEVSEKTCEVAYAIPRDQSLFANETSSLCQKDSLKSVRCHFRYFGNSRPGLILLATDGYSNSFAEHSGFLKAGSDFLKLLQSIGVDRVNESIPGWLEEASREGSGDDVTVGILVREDILQTIFPDNPSLREH